MGTLVDYTLEGSIATITMDDGKVNALSPQMLAELDTGLDQAAADGAVVVLTGRPGVFSGGFDLAVLRAGGPESAAMIRKGFELAARVLAFPTPVVACPGHAIAMGLFLLLSGDHTIGAAGPYKIMANEVAIGLPLPHAAIAICRNRLAPAQFNRALVLAEQFTPETAVPAGVLDQLVDPSELTHAARQVAEALSTLDMEAHATSKLRLRAATLDVIRADIAAGDPVETGDPGAEQRAQQRESSHAETEAADARAT